MNKTKVFQNQTHFIVRMGIIILIINYILFIHNKIINLLI